DYTLRNRMPILHEGAVAFFTLARKIRAKRGKYLAIPPRSGYSPGRCVPDQSGAAPPATIPPAARRPESTPHVSIGAARSRPADAAEQNLMTQDIDFASLGLAAPLLRAASAAVYAHPTPIQAQAIPQVLAGGGLLAGAQTGTGKPAGFTLPVRHQLARTHAHPHPPGRPRCLILTPTRELAA